MMATARWIGVLSLAAITGLPTEEAAAQSYPKKPIHFMVAFPAGGGVDILARAIGQKLSETWSVPVVVENRPGAGGSIGTQLVAKAPPDGYTITLGTLGTHAVNVSLYKHLPYHPIRDFSPVIFVSAAPNLLAVHPSLPVASVKDLIKLARSKPGEINYASSGNGGPPHLAAELFKSMVDVDIVHVPYKGGPPAVAAVVAGEASLAFGTMLTTLPSVKGGKLRPLGVTGSKRSPVLPRLPTIAEAGVPGYEAVAWYGVLVPAGTPGEIISRLNEEISRILKDPEITRRLSAEGAEFKGGSPQRFAAHIRTEIDKWAKVIERAGISID